MFCRPDAKGRCPRHPTIQLAPKKALGRGWERKTLLVHCPMCATEVWTCRMEALATGGDEGCGHPDSAMRSAPTAHDDHPRVVGGPSRRDPATFDASCANTADLSYSSVSWSSGAGSLGGASGGVRRDLSGVDGAVSLGDASGGVPRDLSGGERDVADRVASARGDRS